MVGEVIVRLDWLEGAVGTKDGIVVEGIGELEVGEMD